MASFCRGAELGYELDDIYALVPPRICVIGQISPGVSLAAVYMAKPGNADGSDTARRCRGGRVHLLRDPRRTPYHLDQVMTAHQLDHENVEDRAAAFLTLTDAYDTVLPGPLRRLKRESATVHECVFLALPWHGRHNDGQDDR
jgi:hypothetical protein